MSGIYFDEGVILKSHAATTKGGKSVIRIELETLDPYDLASVLRQLNEIDQEQIARAKAEKAARQPASKPRKPQLALPAPPLQIPHFRGDD